MAINMKKPTILILVAFTIFLGGVTNTAQPVNAATADTTSGASYTLLEPLPCLTGTEVNCQGGKGGQIKNIDLSTYVSYAFNLLIAMSAVLAVLVIVYGGFEYMTTDAWSKKSAGIERVKNALFGLLMVLCAFLIMRTVNPKLVDIPSTIPPLNIRPTGADTAAGFFNTLKQDINNLKVQNLEIANENAAARTAVDASTKKISDWQSQLNQLLFDGASLDDPEVKQLETNIANENNKVNQTESGITLNTTKAALNQLTIGSGDVADTSGGYASLTADQLQQSMDAAGSLYQKGLATAATAGGGAPDPTVKQGLDNTYLSNYDTLYIQKELTSATEAYNPQAIDDARTALNAVVTSQGNQTTVLGTPAVSFSDATQQKAVVDKAKTALSDLDAYAQAHSQSLDFSQ